MSNHEIYHPQLETRHSSKERENNQGLLVLLTGPTGVGKDTVLNKIAIPHERLLSCTSRPPGKNEREGFDYHFLTKERFEEMINAGEFLEYYQNPRGDYYGTLLQEMERRKGDLVIWRLNPDGVFDLLDDQTKRKKLEPFIIICLVAELHTLSERVRKRGREKGWDVMERAKQASLELDKISRKIQATHEEDVIVRRLGEVGYEDIMFHNGHGWTDELPPGTDSRIAVRLIENREGLENQNGLSRTINLATETIMTLNKLWNLT